MILGIASAPTCVLADIIIMAEESCRADGGRPDENRHDSSKLSIRATSTGWKSWIKFNLGELDVGNLETATLTVALNRPKADDQSFDVSCVNDDYLDNIDWDERSLTWNNAPGNNPADTGTVDPTKTTFLTTVNFADGLAGDAFTIDILGALQADTDGIVQFVFHNGSNLLDLATHDHAEETWRPFIDATYKPRQAHDPQPENNAKGVEVLSTTLSWKAGLDPNDPIVPNPEITHHYLWLSLPYDPCDPSIPAEWWNEVGVQKFTIGADADPVDGKVDPNASKVIPGLLKNKLYFWFVDEGLVGNSGPDETDPAKIIWGDVWRFETETTGPEVDAGDSIITWLKDGTTTVNLNGTVTGGVGAVTSTWIVASSPEGSAVDIDNPSQPTTTATLNMTGLYLLQLHASDSSIPQKSDDDVMQINVYDDSCQAAKNNPNGYTPPEFDFNNDCIEDFLDFALFGAKWLEDASLETDLLYDAGEIPLP
jgi:hypothetical protein